MRDYIYRNKTWLNEQYNIKGKSYSQIAIICGVKRDTIAKWVKEFDLKDNPINLRENCQKEVNEDSSITESIKNEIVWMYQTW